jgi:hypothetical protein
LADLGDPRASAGCPCGVFTRWAVDALAELEPLTRR